MRIHALLLIVVDSIFDAIHGVVSSSSWLYEHIIDSDDGAIVAQVRR